MTVPNKRAAGVRLHSFGIPDELWDQVQDAARFNGHERQLSEVVVRKAFERYVRATNKKRQDSSSSSG